MKYILYLIILVGISCFCSACSGAEEVQDDYGFLILNMGISQPNMLVMTKADDAVIDTDEFLVKIANEEGTPDFSFEGTFAKLKEEGTLRLPKGFYEVSAVQPGEMIEDIPFYSGKKVFGILGNSFTDGQEATVICKMAQMGIQIVFKKELLDALKGLPQDICLKIGETKEDSSFLYEFKSWNVESDGSYISNIIYMIPKANLRLSFSAVEKEYEEPFVYNELLKKGTLPIANDYWTVLVELSDEQTKSFSTRIKNMPFKIKATVL